VGTEIARPKPVSRHDDDDGGDPPIRVR